METLIAAKNSIPIEYLYKDENIFNSTYDLNTLSKIYGELEARMILFKKTGEYIQSSMFINENDFLSRFDSWNKRYTTLLKKTLINAKTITSSLAILERTPAFKTGKAVIEKEFRRYTLELNNPTYDDSNIIEIFDYIPLSRRNPIVYLRRDDDTIAVKIFDEPDFKDVDYLNIFDKTAERGLFVYTLTPGADPKNVISYSVSQIYARTPQKSVEVDSSIDWRTFIKRDLYSQTNERTIRVNFNFTMKLPVDFSSTAFLYAISTSDFIGRWLYLFETTSPYIISGDDLSKFYIGFKYAIPQHEDAPSLGNFRILQEGMTTIIRASKVANKNVMDIMIKVIPRIMKYFYLNQSRFIEEINELVPEFIPKVKSREGIPFTKYKALEISFPDLFAPEDITEGCDIEGVRYGSICQCKRQPVFIDDDEAEDTRGFLLKNGERRTLRYFPPPHPETGLPESSRLFFCPMDDTPYPSMRSNLDPTTMDKYPMVPHCVKVDNYDAMVQSYYFEPENIEEGVNFISSGGIPVSSKRLERGSLGRIDDKITNYLNLIFETYFSDTTFVRYGIRDVSKNSLISCLNLVTRKFDISNNEIRKSVFLDGDIIQTYQSLWHLSNDQIDDLLIEMAESDDAIDSMFYLALFEKAFDASVYVLTDSGYEIQSSKGFLIKNTPQKNQKCIILWKYQSDVTVKYPTYDLVVPLIKGKTPRPEGIEDLLFYRENIHKIHSYAYDFFGFKDMNDIWYKFGDCVFEISENFIEKKKLKEFAVSLDQFGKVSMRHVVSQDGTKFSIRVPPSIPKDNSKIISETYKNDIDKIIEVFGRPRNIDEVSVYYSYDLYAGEIGVLHSKNKLERDLKYFDLAEIIRQSRYMKHIVDYLLLYVNNEEEKQELLSKFETDVDIGFERLESRYLPRKYKTLDEAINYLSTISPNFYDGKFVLEYYLAESIINYIKNYEPGHKKENLGDFFPIDYTLKGSFFLEHNAKLFLDQKELEKWNCSNSRQDFFKIEDTITSRNNIYVYYDKSMYFIHPAQNFEDAKRISQEYLFPYANYISDNVMFFEEINGKMLRSNTDFTDESDPDKEIFSQVLRYFNGQYAAVVEVFRSDI